MLILIESKSGKFQTNVTKDSETLTSSVSFLVFVTLVISGTTTLNTESLTDSFMTIRKHQTNAPRLFGWRSRYLLGIIAVVVFFVSCDNDHVSRAEYNAALLRADSLEAQNDELQIELSDLKLYNDYLEKTIDSLQKGDYQR